MTKSLAPDQTDVHTSISTELKGLILNRVCCRLLVFPGAGPGISVRKTLSLQGSGMEIQYFPGGPLANFYGNLYNLNVVFKGIKVRTRCLHSDPHMLLL